MTEIYSYDVATHERFARDQQEVEAFRKQYHIPTSGARAVAVQTAILDFVPKHPALDLLMQTHQRKMWAHFSIPTNYYLQRFASSYVAPSLGGKEKQNADIQRLEAYLKRRQRGRYLDNKYDVNEEREEWREKGEKERGDGKESDEREMFQEGERLIHLLEGVKEINEMVDYVFARIHQFVQA